MSNFFFIYLTLLFQLLSNDLDLKYVNITVEPYGVLSSDRGVPEFEATKGDVCPKP